MRRGYQRAGSLAAALLVLSTSAFAGATGLVLCVANGHRALELEHPGMECPALASPEGAATSLHPSADCLDLPGAGAPLLSSADRDPKPTAALDPSATPESALGVETRRAPSDARVAPPNVARHLPSTVLLV